MVQHLGKHTDAPSALGISALSPDVDRLQDNSESLGDRLLQVLEMVEQLLLLVDSESMIPLHATASVLVDSCCLSPADNAIIKIKMKDQPIVLSELREQHYLSLLAASKTELLFERLVS